MKSARLGDGTFDATFHITWYYIYRLTWILGTSYERISPHHIAGIKNTNVTSSSSVAVESSKQFTAGKRASRIRAKAAQGSKSWHCGDPLSVAMAPLEFGSRPYRRRRRSFSGPRGNVFRSRPWKSVPVSSKRFLWWNGADHITETLSAGNQTSLRISKYLLTSGKLISVLIFWHFISSRLNWLVCVHCFLSPWWHLSDVQCSDKMHVLKWHGLVYSCFLGAPRRYDVSSVCEWSHLHNGWWRSERTGQTKWVHI